MSLIPLLDIRTPASVCQLELASSHPELSSLGDPTQVCQSMLILVRLHGFPIGLFAADSPRNASGQSSLIAELQGAARNEAGAHLESDNLPTICSSLKEEPPCRSGYTDAVSHPPPASVVICTRGRTHYLSAALASVLELEYPDFEVLVVDNPRTDETRKVVARFAATDARIRWIREDRPGLSVGRNRGVQEARNEIMAFTDDDATVDREWLGRIVARFRSDAKVQCVTGLVLPLELETQAQLWYEQFGGFPKSLNPALYDLGPNRPDSKFFPMSAGVFGSGNNMAFRRSFIRDIGGFDPALGAGTACGGEDVDMFFRTIMAGYTLAYEPAAIVWHAHRRDYRALLGQVASSGTTGFLTKYLVENPGEIVPFLSKLPPAVAAYLFGPRGKYRKETMSVPWSLRLADIRGFALGPILYAVSRARTKPGAATSGTEK